MVMRCYALLCTFKHLSAIYCICQVINAIFFRLCVVMSLKSFGERLVEVRNAADYKGRQQDFAALYQKSKRTWSDYETGKAYPDVDVIIRICNDWDVNPRWLIKGVGEMFESQKSMGNVQEILQDLPLAEILEVQHLITDLLTAKLLNRDQQQ
jgi:transcriptional regulator with XRE-family HTH domain